MKKHDLQNDVLAALLINPLPASPRLNLFLDEEFCRRLRLEPMFWYPLNEHISVETGSLYKAFRAAWNGRKTASLTLKDGGRVRAKLGKQKCGKATLLIRKEGFAFSFPIPICSARNRRKDAMRW
ncbi:hypothetical protein [Breoghania sp.]|uniref:hypothetical protein n=1 Tax=Breoghania sp. TaxID=2065378 RepID=UPI00261D6A3F|nr:hypothetical protein [Breoghania sp.]MDJ0931297.1 hypothetical protein [Breoghania sp.]